MGFRGRPSLAYGSLFCVCLESLLQRVAEFIEAFPLLIGMHMCSLTKVVSHGTLFPVLNSRDQPSVVWKVLLVSYIVMFA